MHGVNHSCYSAFLFSLTVEANSSVQAALASAKSASDGQPESKRAHTEIDEVVKGMSSDNQALFRALTGFMDSKMEKRFGDRDYIH